ncbi:MAG TPA: hypothetical protein VMU11_02225 [Verrucomicrobiae bacterium]|nr:hypothetical protein [Verrucomicrobiae bacterium]
MSQRLVILYDSDPGFLSALADAGKRLMNDPSTSLLYRLTHGLIFEKRAWSDFLAKQPMAVEYHHRRFEGLAAAPAVLKERDGSISAIVTSEDIADCRSLEDLIKRVEAGVLTGFAG